MHQTRTNSKLLWMAAIVAALLTACGVSEQLVEDPAEALESTELRLTQDISSVTGSLAASGTSWVTHPIELSAPGHLELSLGWASAGANLNLFFYGLDGKVAASANGSTERPERLSIDVAAPGRYLVGIKCKTGASSYTLTASFAPAYVETSFAGEAAAAGPSWLTHTFDAQAGERLDVTLDWTSSSADFNVFLYAPSVSSPLAYANGTTARPEVLSVVATASGTWSVSLKCKTGASAYSLRVRRSASTGTPDAGPPPPPPFTPAYAGQPRPSTLHWGAAISGNGDPVSRHETAAGRAMGVHRTFWQWADRTSRLVDTAADDLAAERIPWVSVKTPSWAAMGNGQYDAEIDAMLRALSALGGPVWLTLHHEPEGGGGVNSPDDPAGPAGHVAMNRRVRQRLTALGVRNVALAPVLMSYTFKSASGRDPEAWFAPGIYDFIGIDHYRDSEATLLDSTWASIRGWARSKGLDLAVGEWGMRGTDAAAGQRVREWFDAAAASATDGAGARVVGLCAFDSGLNSPSGSWELAGEQRTMFRQFLLDPRAVLATP